jgi:hypothetical protein
MNPERLDCESNHLRPDLPVRDAKKYRAEENPENQREKGFRAA